jgi:hypothetical protein
VRVDRKEPVWVNIVATRRVLTPPVATVLVVEPTVTIVIVTLGLPARPGHYTGHS